MMVLETFPPGLNGFYERMINSLPSLEEDLCKEILSVVSILKRPVTIEELLPLLHSYFSDNMETLEEVIQSCGSFLKIQAGKIYFVHQSAVEFLKSSASKLSTIAERHKSVFWSSMDVLNRPGYLKRDIYGLKEPSTDMAEIHIPEPNPLCALQYSCTYWVDHLADWVCEKRIVMGEPLPQEECVILEVSSFLRRKFLNWIEALSLLRQMQGAIQAIQKLQVLFNQSPGSIEQGLSAFIHDANRFLLYHKVIIEKTPLQLYASALLFSPKQSVVKAQFRDEAPDWVTITPGLETTWSACLQTLYYDLERCIGACSVAYSPDGEWLVTLYFDGTVKLWHAKSGTCTHTVSLHGGEHLKYSMSMVSFESKSVAFSADGKSFVSSSCNGDVKVWDRDTGRCTYQIEPHPSLATEMAISSDGSTVALYDRGRIVIRSTKGEFSTRTIECHPQQGEVHSIALNANGQWIALGSTNHLLEIFDVSTGGCQQISTDHNEVTVAWSPDGAWVVSGGALNPRMNFIVQIWERRTGKSILRLKHEAPSDPGYEDIPTYMNLSADKRFLAAGSRCDICVWNTSTGALTWAMYGSDLKYINSISFSPDAQRVVSASYPSTIKVWDLSIMADSISHRPSPSTGQVIFTDDDRFLAYDLLMDKIRLYDRRADMPDSTFYEESVCTIALSQEGQRLALASFDKTTITIWNTSTRAITLKICGRTEHICFDARGSEESVCQRRHWNNEIAADVYLDEVSRRRNGPKRIACLAFGNASQLASSLGGLIKIWNTSNGRCSQTIDSGCSYATNMTFSSQGQRLAFLAYDDERMWGGYDVIIQVWDVATKQCISTLSWEETSTLSTRSSLSFSGEQQLVSCENKWTKDGLRLAVICLWNLRSDSIITRTFTSDKISFVHARFDTRLANRLHTAYGFFDTRELLSTSSSSCIHAGSRISKKDFEYTPDSESAEAMPPFRGYGFSYDREWIMRDGKRLLWIPPDFRPSDEPGDITPGMNGSSIMWLRDSREPVRMYFTE
ncbi:uncharacterized protein CCOS01_07209 [Colletotrichum costaricense]|uniref:Mitochondrial division protein 1 n=1 Tax=Colletotrichum costaricense TaxID=1209916 RepID=A0AAI9YW60_9PEZI|nr:uncharacterized protein CCOS01_07209 [Colletotrichum costaricense]KAK1526947.1 hypothetical protein CCOS01_07209 [Colletotrichum costaricense]